MNKQKAMLDALMGLSRNVADKDKTGEDFLQASACKHYIVGLCPDALVGALVAKERDEEAKHKDMPAPCKKTHAALMRQELEGHPEVKKHRREFEQSLLRRLEDISADADRLYSVEKRKVRAKESYVQLPDSIRDEIYRLQDKHKQGLTDAEEKGVQGDIEGAQTAMESVRIIQADMDRISADRTIEFPGEEACTICGTRYLVGAAKDVATAQRLWGYVWQAEHMSSKIHVGYVRIREELVKLRGKAAAAPAPPIDRADPPSSRGGAAVEERANLRRRSRSADKGRRRHSRSRSDERARRRSRSGEREKKRSRTCEREKRRSRSRGKAGGGRSRSRSRSRGRRDDRRK